MSGKELMNNTPEQANRKMELLRRLDEGAAEITLAEMFRQIRIKNAHKSINWQLLDLAISQGYRKAL